VRRAERGTVATMVALLLVPMMGMLALTVDVGYAYGQRRLAQNVADSAAVNATMVVGKRIMASSETYVKDADVTAAITTVASRSSGGFSLASGLRADYVRRESNGTFTDVGDVGTGVTCTSDGTTGCIPSTATGVRVYSTTTFNTFFGAVLNKTTLATGARATAVNVVPTEFASVAPYALWTGEDGTGQINGQPAPNFLCMDSGNRPVELNIGGTRFPVPLGNRTSDGYAYSYACTGGTDDPIAQGTFFTVRSAPNFETPNVSSGNPNWNIGSSNFKGFIRLEDASRFVGIGSYLSTGGVANGDEDAGMEMIQTCFQPQFQCTLIMPIVSYAWLDGSSGHPRMLVTGFAQVRVDAQYGANTQDPTTAPTSYDWKARVVNAPVACCPTNFSYEITPGMAQLLWARLVQ
jgi:Flp pilus assembly protein TadG